MTMTSTKSSHSDDDSTSFEPPPSSPPNSPPSSSPWKDLPRRVLTVAIGVPSITCILRHPTTSWLFFQGAHILCLIEWFALLPPGSVATPPSTDPKKRVVRNDNDDNDHDDDDDEDGDKERKSFLEKLKEKLVSPSLTRLLLDDRSNDGETTPAATIRLRLSKWLYLQFVAYSIVLSAMPTKFLPPGLMASVLALRLSLHLPWFPSASSGHQHPHHLHAIQLQQQWQDLVALQHYQLGFLSISLGFHYLLQIAIFKGGPVHIGFLLFVVWMADTGALIFGRIYGKVFTMRQRQQQQQQQQQEVTSSENRQKQQQQQQQQQHQQRQPHDKHIGFFMSFVNSISPGKTLPGLIGAILTGPLSALLYPIDWDYNGTDSCPLDGDTTLTPNPTTNGFCPNEKSYHQILTNTRELKLLLGFLLSLAGVLGDLAESSVKRTARVKDSGGLLPGHGGILDRFDSVLVSGVVYYYLVWE